MSQGILSGKVALVTGAAGDMGIGIARLLAREGAKVMATDRASRDWAKAFADVADQITCRLHDVSRPDEWKTVVGETEARFGAPVTVLVNNAGISGPGMPLLQETEELYRDIVGTNLGGVYHGTRAVVPGMQRAGGGSIVNISSVAGLVASPGLFAYTGSKFGVAGLTKTAAAELGTMGIRVNCVHPGVIDTDMVRRGAPEVRAAVEERVAALPIARLGRPEEIAEAVLFFASDRASFCTGVSLPVDGGWTMV